MLAEFAARSGPEERNIKLWQATQFSGGTRRGPNSSGQMDSIKLTRSFAHLDLPVFRKGTLHKVVSGDTLLKTALIPVNERDIAGIVPEPRVSLAFHLNKVIRDPFNPLTRTAVPILLWSGEGSAHGNADRDFRPHKGQDTFTYVITDQLTWEWQVMLKCRS